MKYITVYMLVVFSAIALGCSVNRTYSRGNVNAEMTLYIDQWNGPKWEFSVEIDPSKVSANDAYVDVSCIKSMRQTNGSGKEWLLPVADYKGGIFRISDSEWQIDFLRKSKDGKSYVIDDELKYINGVYKHR